MPVVILLIPEWMAVAWVRMSRDASRTFRTTVDDNGLRTAGAHSETIAGWPGEFTLPMLTGVLRVVRQL
jgi:hypothetical protein